ncbi:Transmembrane protein 188 [Mucor velutinosus]|uniref:Transmembrane protein 188 n=1 Tax=Mucor velutinosus TaxID=708070 RepID=A0AAN7I4A8_9FUNG|nr:Transmembrane protein 188 [Mucor velutinosus]
MTTANDNIAKFKQFDQYDFDKDSQFQSGVASLLNNKQENEADLLLRAKLFYYTKVVDTSFNADAYKTWKNENQEPAIEQGKNSDDKPPRFTFQELVDMIEKGIEIPGIKQIPNVLNEGTPSKAKMTARPKPWETNKQQQQEQEVVAEEATL